jgi:GT2 family glycosyltransferase
MISVIIPTCERPELLVRCLERLSGADEVIVSDDSKSDSTLQLVLERFPQARWIKGPRRGPAANRNLAARHASGDKLAFIDDDCIPDELWVWKMRSALAAAVLVEGRTICPDQTRGILEEAVENLCGGLLWSCNFGIHRGLFMELGGFDEDFEEAGGEDLEFAWRVKARNIPVEFVAEAMVYHPARSLSPGRWFYRIFQDRWHVLYRLKRTPARLAVIDECKDLVRLTARLVLRIWESKSPGYALSILMRWILFPLWFSYLLKWELRFRWRLARSPRRCIYHAEPQALRTTP